MPSTTARGEFSTLKHLDNAGLSHAGTGRNLAEARAPGYLDTPRGRLALVSATATYRPWNRAGAQRPDLKGRPGVNPLGFQTTYAVDPRAFQELRRTSSALGLHLGKERNRGHFYSAKEIPDERRKSWIFSVSASFRARALLSPQS